MKKIKILPKTSLSYGYVGALPKRLSLTRWSVNSPIPPNTKRCLSPSKKKQMNVKIAQVISFFLALQSEAASTDKAI